MAIRATKSMSFFDVLASEVVKASKGSRASAAFRSASAEIRSLEQHDYARPLRRSLGRSEVREIIREARSSVWPRLNDESVKLVSPSEFTRLWSGLGVQFQLAKLGGVEGVALLGFYVREMGGSRLPLICVNTAHHPAAIGAAFSHEMGHHLVGRLFDSREAARSDVDLHRLWRASAGSEGTGSRRSREPRRISRGNCAKDFSDTQER